MKENIIEYINDPEILEELYRENRNEFVKAFAEIAGDYNSDLVRFWKIRLAKEMQAETKRFIRTDLLAVIILTLFTGLLIKLPDMFPHIIRDTFYIRDLAIIIFNGTILYMFWQNKVSNKINLLFYASVIVILTVFLNLLPLKNTDSLILSFIHSPLLLWCLFGLAFISFDYKNTEKKIQYIRYNGEFLVMIGLISTAGSTFIALTIGLFHAISIDISVFITDYVVVFGGAATPIVACWLIRLYPNITSKIVPVIARVFTPLVLVTLAVYLISFIFSNHIILKDRDLLIIFNVMLIAVLAIIVFSISELDKTKEKNLNVLVLFILAILTIFINSIVLTNIVSRVLSGLTPNRLVVLVSNILIFVNLILIARSLFLSYFKNKPLDAVEKAVAKYLAVYAVWTIIVIFVLPFVFGFK